MLDAPACRYAVIPLSIQEEQDVYLVGSSERGDFYHFPRQGVDILTLLQSGATAPAIKAELAAQHAETVDVDDFIEQLSSIGFIHPAGEAGAGRQTSPVPQGKERIFNVDPRIARAVFSAPVMVCGLAALVYAAAIAIADPRLRLNVDAFYTDTNRTALLLVVLALSLAQVALHETGHMMAAARQGVKSRYGVGNRLWTVVAQSDLTGLLALPKSRRYVPMLAGVLVDILCVAALTIVLQTLLRHGAGPFTIQVVQALVLEILIGVTWQFNIFVKTDIYFVLCNYFSHPDLDREARAYLGTLVHRASMGRFGARAAGPATANRWVMSVFSAIWLLGRILSLLILLTVFLPTMARYVESAFDMLRSSPTSIWPALDTLLYVLITMTMLSAGMYMWLKPRLITAHHVKEKISG